MSPDFFVYGDVLEKAIKRRAKKALKSKKRCVTSIIFSFLSAATGIFAVRFVMFNFSKQYALAAGIALSAVYFTIKSCTNYRIQVQMILLLTNGEKPDIGITEYLKNILLTFCLSALKIIEFVAFEAIPVGIVAALFFSIKRSALSASFCLTALVGAAITSVLGLIFFAFSVQKYTEAPFMLAAYPALSVADCIKLSVQRGEKKAADLLRFKLGFLPWLLACIAIFPLLYVVPYYKQSLTCWFKQES